MPIILPVRVCVFLNIFPAKKALNFVHCLIIQLVVPMYFEAVWNLMSCGYKKSVHVRRIIFCGKIIHFEHKKIYMLNRVKVTDYPYHLTPKSGGPGGCMNWCVILS